MKKNTQPIADLMDESISKLKATLTDSEIMKGTILDIIILHVTPIKRKELLRQAKIEQPIITIRDNFSDRRMRRLIMELIADGHAIASSEKGYSMINNVRELTEAVNYLKSKAKALQIRSNTLMGNFSRTYQQDTPAHLQFKLF